LTTTGEGKKGKEKKEKEKLERENLVLSFKGECNYFES